jgi:hypothetical protein
MFRIRFWWAGYSPEEALDPLNFTVVETPFEVSQDGGRTWRPPANGADLMTVQDYRRDKGLDVVDTQLVGQRRNGSWEGQYILIVGPVQ